MEPHEGDDDLVYAERLVNYSKLDATENSAKQDHSAESVAHTVTLREKIGDSGGSHRVRPPGLLDVPGRKTPVGGVLLHASAAYTLLKEPSSS